MHGVESVSHLGQETNYSDLFGNTKEKLLFFELARFFCIRLNSPFTIF
jgi:hypothetical protein